MVDNATNQFILNTVQVNNNAAFEKARVKHELTDEQHRQVGQFVQERLRPNQLGMYTEQDVDYAVNALFGAERMASEKLKTANNINKTIQRGSKQVPIRATSTKTEQVPKDVQSAREYGDFVRTLVAAK